MSMILNSARFLVFGPKMDATISLQGIAKRKGMNMARRVFGLPPSRGPGFRDWLAHELKRAWSTFFGYDSRNQLPSDLPMGLFKAIDSTLRNRGGLVNDAPNYWLNISGATSTPFFWSLVVEYAPTADPAKVSSFEVALEDAITRAGFDYNVRIQRRPLRIEIDKPKPPTVTLSELWPVVAEYPQNERHCVLGRAHMNGHSVTLGMDLNGEDFSCFIAASSGGGKTQLAMSMLLSLAMSNSPDSLTMVIVDPKAIDFQPFNALPHLALPIVNESTYAAEVIQWLCGEMDRRTAQAARGDKSFLKHSILLYIDELADLAMSLPDTQGKELTANIQRLGQKGRGVGFVLIGATQRVYDIDAKMQSKLNARIVGKMRTANDSQSASGIPGTTTNKLPGRGSFELYCSDQVGLRIQAPFVAASDKDGYEAKLQPFFDDICERWIDAGPGWRPPGTPTQATVEVTEMAQDAPQMPILDAAVVDALKAKAGDNLNALSVNAVRQTIKELTGKEPRNDRAKVIRQTFFDMVATEVSGTF